MPFKITNTSNGPVLVRLRSGATLHLLSGEESPELEDADVRSNSRLEPLVTRGLVSVQEVAATSPGGGTRGAAGARGRSRSRRPRADDEGASA